MRKAVGVVTLVLFYIVMFWVFPIASVYDIKAALQLILKIHLIVIGSFGISLILVWAFN